MKSAQKSENLKDLIKQKVPEIHIRGQCRDVRTAMSVYDRDNQYTYVGEAILDGKEGYLYRRVKCQD